MRALAAYTHSLWTTLAAFPLEGTFLSDGRTLGETLPTSIAPSALRCCMMSNPSRRALVFIRWETPIQRNRTCAGARPRPLRLAELGKRLERSANVKVQWQASRDWFINALRTGLVVNASCHGIFDTA